MKEIDELNLPDDFRYSEDHEYAHPLDDRYRVGINDYAQDQLGDIVYVELPAVGDRFEKGGQFGTVESVKAVVELFMPIGGEVTAVNTLLEESPGNINSDPYGTGWMIEVRSDAPDAFEKLMDRATYLKMIQGQ